MAEKVGGERRFVAVEPHSDVDVDIPDNQPLNENTFVVIVGNEDYSNEIFVDYSSTLYNFEQVRREMDFIRGKTDKHGNVRIKQFLNALASYCQ